MSEEPKRKPRKASPKPRGRSPAPGGGGGGAGEEDHPSSPRKTGGGKKKGLPVNPSRNAGGSGSPTNNNKEEDRSHRSKERSGHSKERSHHKKERSGRNMSPKRDNSKNGNLNETNSSAKGVPKRSAHDKPQTPVNRARSPKRNDAAPASPKRNGARGRSPESSARRPKNCNSGEGDKETSGRGPKRSTSPKREEGQKGKKPASGKKNKPKSKNNNNRDPCSTPPEPSYELTAENDDATESSCSEPGSPRYVSPKGNTTHLQLDLSKMGGADMPVFSLLDDNSLLDQSTDEEGSRSKSPRRRPRSQDPDAAQKRDGLLDSVNAHKQDQQKRASAVHPKTELEFTPWGFEEKDDNAAADAEKKKPSFFPPLPGSNAPKGSLSPLGKRAMKAFKYTTPSMAGAQNLMGKLNKNFQQRMGLAPQHEQMKDEDDLASLL